VTETPHITPTPPHPHPHAEHPPRPHIPSRWRLVAQIAAFAVGLAILFLFIHKAAAPENREKFDKLWQAPARDIAALLALSLASLALNGGIFWVTLFPVRRLRPLEVIAVNAGATLLAYLPLKLSALSRFVIHNRRDHVPLFTIAAWMGAVGVSMAASLAPPILAAVWRKHVDGLFIAATFAGLIVTYCLTLAISTVFAHARGLARLHRLTDPLNLKLLNRIMHSAWFHNFHAGFAMLAHPVTLALSMLFRAGDLLVQAARFALAAQVVGVALTWEEAILVATTFFLIGVVSPAGNLGTREGGATAFASLLPDLPSGSFIVVTLVVSASEMITNAVCGLTGLIYLRPDRLLRAPAAQPEHQESPGSL
jgi:hypothetical protein